MPTSDQQDRPYQISIAYLRSEDDIYPEPGGVSVQWENHQGVVQLFASIHAAAEGLKIPEEQVMTAATEGGMLYTSVPTDWKVQHHVCIGES